MRWALIVLAVVVGPLAANLPASAGELELAPSSPAAPASQAGTDDQAQRFQFFEQHVRPLLAQHCWGCHGPEKQQADLRLDALSHHLAGGTSGPAIVPGHPEQSLLIEAVRYESLEMPPDGRLSDEQIAVLVRWIGDGAVWPEEAHVRQPSSEFTAEDRAYWAFQPLHLGPVPAVSDSSWCRSTIDAFVLAKLESAQLQPAPPADRATWARRVYLDLTGLVPERDELQRYLSDHRPGAEERLVDHLLASPRYGEQMARMWLDLVRYAESDGYKQDAYRPSAWRYRDYVLQSLNADKPYGQFVTEQLAGDELQPTSLEAQVATGYLRLYLYEYNQRDALSQWAEIQNQLTDVTADVFLGLGFACARCHDHKFDPILREDYYRLQAFFAAMLPSEVEVAEPTAVAEHRRLQTQWLEVSAVPRAELAAIEEPYRRRAALGAISKFPPQVQAIYAKPADQRTPLEQQVTHLVDLQIEVEYGALKLSETDQARAEPLRRQLRELAVQPPTSLPTALTVRDLGRVEPEVVMPGDRRRRSIAPGFLTLLAPGPAQLADVGSAPTTGRRLALARWLTQPDNPLTWRVMANRLWQHHFGLGLVASPSDLGRLGDPPSHPELLDYLAQRLIQSQGSWKDLQREIVLSAVYRQSAEHPGAESCRLVDPRNTLRWRWEVKRMSAEQLRDNVLSITGQLDGQVGGPSVPHDAARRSIYTKVLRNSPAEMLATFDAPDRILSIAQRVETTSVTQALWMLNSTWAVNQAQELAKRVQAQCPSPTQSVTGQQAERLQREYLESMVTQAFELVLRRSPFPHELVEGVGYLTGQPSTQVALTELCQVLLNANEFAYIE